MFVRCFSRGTGRRLESGKCEYRRAGFSQPSVCWAAMRRFVLTFDLSPAERVSRLVLSCDLNCCCTHSSPVISVLSSRAMASLRLFPWQPTCVHMLLPWGSSWRRDAIFSLNYRFKAVHLCCIPNDSFEATKIDRNIYAKNNNWRVPWKNWICSTTMKLRKSLVKPVTRQRTCNYIELFEIVLHDTYIWGRSQNNIKCVVHDDLRQKNQTTRYNRFWRARCSRLEYIDIRSIY